MWSKENTFRIGIDKISLYNFQIKSGQLKKISDPRKNSLKETSFATDEFFSLISIYSLSEENSEIKEKVFNKITFNPNKILTGDNVCNSSTEDLAKALKKLKDILKEKGFFIEFSEAKIADIEVNLNIPVDFDEYSEVFELFIRQFKIPKLTGVFVENEERAKSILLENFFSRKNRNITFKIYSKTREKGLAVDITRMEYFLETSAYKYFFEKYKKDNSLKTLLENSDMLKILFLERVKKDFLLNSIRYIENEIKPILEREYLNFKSINRLARRTGRREKRNVYRYLEKFWIFDYSFLIELIDKYDIKNRGRETKKIMKGFLQHNNLEKLNYLEEFIFLSNSVREEKQGDGI